MLSIGDVLKGRYRVDRMLDIGALGGQYGGWDLDRNEPVLIKELLPQPDLEPETLATLRATFEKDAAALARLDHPHITRISDHFCAPTLMPGSGSRNTGTGEVNAYLVQDMVPGQTLADVIKREGAIREARVGAWAEQLLEGLDHAHRQGVCHRDIKPDNILITPDDRAMLINFEIVALWNPLDPRTWTAKRVMGTPDYAPPECWGMKMTHVDTRSDIYSLGATLYHTLTGQQPLTAGERTSNPYRFLQVKALNPKVGAATRDVVLKAMELPRDKRYQSAEEMSKALQRRSEFDRSGAPPPASIWPAYGPRPWTRERKPGLKLILLGALVIAGAGLGFLWLNQTGYDWRTGIRGAIGLAAEDPLLTRTPADEYGSGAGPSPVVESAYPVATAVTAPDVATLTQAPGPGTGASTPRPSLSPTPATLGLTSAPPPGWQNVVEEGFADNRYGWLISENEDDWGSMSRRIEDGTYRWTVNATQAVGRWVTLELPEGAGLMSDFYAGVDAQRVSGPPAAAYGLLLRQSAGSYYVFNVRDDGHYQFSLWYGYEWRPIIDWTQTTAVRPGQVNRLTVRAQDGRFELFINDQRVAEAQDDQIPQGGIGLSISTAATEGDAVFVFDNFTLWSP